MPDDFLSMKIPAFFPGKDEEGVHRITGKFWVCESVCDEVFFDGEAGALQWVQKKGGLATPRGFAAEPAQDSSEGLKTGALKEIRGR